MHSYMGISPAFKGRLKVSEVVALKENGFPIVKKFTAHMPPQHDRLLANKADDLTGGEKMSRVKLLKEDAKRLYSLLGDIFGRTFNPPENTVMVNTSNIRYQYEKYVSLHSDKPPKVGDVLLKMDLCE